MSLVKDLHALARKGRSADLAHFFKAFPGGYGEGDVFIGVIVPDTRIVAKKHIDLSFAELEKVIASPIHEERLCGLIILTLRYKRDKDEQTRKKIFTFYMKMLRAGHVNSWDLVDVSAPIIGDYLISEPKHLELLEKLSRSRNLWQRRTAMVFTFAFLRKGITGPTVVIAENLLGDSHDLIHKAVGWMLREMGKRDPYLLRSFLKENAPEMPRTALRYSIERLPETERKRWLAIKPSGRSDLRSSPLSKRR
jgi:3-methyladenine DNA glycosylase AlkD